jgi:DNA-binding NarL/FixJ family response regulator
LNLARTLFLRILGKAFQESDMDKPIRILVANRSRLIRELLLATLGDRPNIEVVGEVSSESEIPASVKRTAPDVLVISLDELGKRPRICDTVLRAHPDLRIVAVATDHNRSVCYWASLQLDIHSSDIEPSEEGLLGVMRQINEDAGGQA